jgi:peptidoglycan/xylan/chitin deacetylase (PgdA/CDA1 family)
MKPRRLIRTITNYLSEEQHGRTLSIFVFHKVTKNKRPFYQDMPDKNEFELILKWIKAQFNVEKLQTALSALENKTLEPSTAAVTFDDGDAETWECASEILSSQQIPATFFINTAYLEKGAPNHEYIYTALENTSKKILDLRDFGQSIVETDTPRKKRLIADLLCTKAKYLPPDQAEALAKDIQKLAHTETIPSAVRASDIEENFRDFLQFGGHSHKHNILTTLPENVARHEIETCKSIITSLTKEVNPIFAYPNGKPKKDFTPLHEMLVSRAGFKAACSYTPGVFRENGNYYNIPRFTPWDRSELTFQARMLLNFRTKLVPSSNQ